MTTKYDYVIIGAGIGGLCCAYKLRINHPNASIVVFDKGASLSSRTCIKINNKDKECSNCNVCSIMHGVGGAGAYSDGKFNNTIEYGGDLQKYIGENLASQYIDELDNILISFGATCKSYESSAVLHDYFEDNGIILLKSKVKHLGTDGNLIVMNNLVKWLTENNVIISEMSTARELYNNELHCQIKGENKVVKFGKLIYCVGRSGSENLYDLWKIHGIKTYNNCVDIGVRVELARCVWEDISQEIYEPKLIYTTRKYHDKCRVFCFNSGGEVVFENLDGIKTVNGHANSNEELKTDNSNFAILNSIIFTEPFDDPIEYAKSLATLTNKVGGENVIVQRFGDLINGKRSTKEKIKNNSVRPTLNATPGDLSLCIPKRQLDNIIEMIYALDVAVPGTAHGDTLLYGLEAKYYSSHPEFINDKFEVLEDIYCIGDGSGVTRSLSQAGAMGLYLGDRI